jgi:XTP/dITP diphosphohydrolase
MAGIPPELRTARFVCDIAWVDGLHEPWTVEGTCSGRLLSVPAGEGGFGYDPLFVPDGYGQTYSQLPAEVKNRISHRGRALQAFTEKYYTVNNLAGAD